MSPNPYQAKRQRVQANKRARIAREAHIQSIHTALTARLQHPDVQHAIQRAWDEREQYRAALKMFRRMGGISVLDRLGRLYEIAKVGTIREKSWLVEQLEGLWSNPPQEVIQDSYCFDIHIKVRSLKNTQGRGGQNPYEWKREDKMSVVNDTGAGVHRAHIRQVAPASMPELTKWLKKAIKKLPDVDDAIAKIEDRLHRARASAHAFAETPEGRWMGVDSSMSRPGIITEKK